jgi:hypothetical protein
MILKLCVWSVYQETLLEHESVIITNNTLSSHCSDWTQLGDVGNKLGDHGIDTGYIRFKNVRIPRKHLFSKRQHVTAEGRSVRCCGL